MHPVQLSDNQFLSCEICLGGPRPGAGRKAVVTEENLLTPEEIRQNKEAVDAAILEEFTIWVKYGVFKVVKKKPGQNVLTSRFVATWKVVEDISGKKPGSSARGLSSEVFKIILHTCENGTAEPHRGTARSCFVPVVLVATDSSSRQLTSRRPFYKV